MKRIIVTISLFATGIAIAQPTNPPPVHLIFQPQMVTVISGATTNHTTYCAVTTNEQFVLTIPMTNCTVKSCAGVLLGLPASK